MWYCIVLYCTVLYEAQEEVIVLLTSRYLSLVTLKKFTTSATTPTFSKTTLQGCPPHTPPHHVYIHIYTHIYVYVSTSLRLLLRTRRLPRCPLRAAARFPSCRRSSLVTTYLYLGSYYPLSIAHCLLFAGAAATTTRPTYYYYFYYFYLHYCYYYYY